MNARFGATDRLVPVIGQGTWQVASRGAAADEVVRTLQRGLDLGLTHVDTAELYTGAEALVAKAIAGRRDAVFLVSKVHPRNASRTGTIAACEQSLRRLGTDHLDVYLHHWPDGSHPISETMAGLHALVQAGKTRHIGVSNYDVPELEEALAALDGVPLVCNQVLYNLDERGIEPAVLPWCEAHDVAVVGYTPFANQRMFRPGVRGFDVLDRIATRLGRTPRQVALRFLTRRPSLFAIPKASSLAHVEENAGGQDFDLTVEDIAAIDGAFPGVP